jgi:large subunit ribosomal protein L29
MKKKAFLDEIRNLSAPELRSRVRSLSEEQMKLRFQSASGNSASGSRRAAIRKEVARILTVLNKSK